MQPVFQWSPKPAIIRVALLLATVFCVFRSARAIDYDEHLVLQAIQSSRQQLLNLQLPDGRFPADGTLTHSLGTTALATLALCKTAHSDKDEHVQLSTDFLRRQDWSTCERTHELALATTLLITLNDPKDLPLIQQLTRQLIQLQMPNGGWPHRVGVEEGDLSISLFAIIALRDVDRSGIRIPLSVWQRAHEHWRSLQNPDGGWFDFSSEDQPESTAASRATSTPTGTLAGIAALTICEDMIAQATPASTRQTAEESLPRRKATAFLQQDQTSRTKLITPKSIVSFHLYGLEVGGRPRGRLIENEADWDRTGTASLFGTRNPRTELWTGTNKVIATSYALLYLSTHYSPALINRIHFANESPSCPHDVWNLTEVIIRTRNWKRTLTARDVELSHITEPYQKSPVLYLTHSRFPEISDEEVSSLKAYLQQGGTLLASPGEHSDEFETGFQALLKRLFPLGEVSLAPLEPGHPIYQLHPEVNAEATPLEGVDFGCRTTIFYSRTPLSPVWESSLQQPHLTSPGQDSAHIARHVKLGMSIIEYAVGMEWPPFPKAEHRLPQRETPPQEEPFIRGRMSVAQLQVRPGWSPVPHSIPTLLKHINRVYGDLMQPTPAIVPIDSPDIFDHVLLCLHGSDHFTPSEEAVSNLKAHLERGGMLFADACCSSSKFDASFRNFVSTLFPGQELKPISLQHDFYVARPAFRIHEIRLRKAMKEENEPFPSYQEILTPPELEGIEINGRLAIIYSRYDLSCAMENPSRLQCEGYPRDDALKIASNIAMYALLQDFGTPPETTTSSLNSN